MFEILIQRRPVSQQTRRRERLREWQSYVRSQAEGVWSSDQAPREGLVALTLLYLYEEAALDVDNIAKPIQDALKGLVFTDDALVSDAIIRRRNLAGEFDLTDVPSLVLEGFERGGEFIYVRVTEAPPQEILL